MRGRDHGGRKNGANDGRIGFGTQATCQVAGACVVGGISVEGCTASASAGRTQVKLCTKQASVVVSWTPGVGFHASVKTLQVHQAATMEVLFLNLTWIGQSIHHYAVKAHA